MIEKLKAIAAKRTKGVATVMPSSVYFNDGVRNQAVVGCSRHADAEFIAMASNCFDEMLAVVEIAEKIQISHFDGDGQLYILIDSLVLRLDKLHTKIKTELGE